MIYPTKTTGNVFFSNETMTSSDDRIRVNNDDNTSKLRHLGSGIFEFTDTENVLLQIYPTLNHPRRAVGGCNLSFTETELRTFACKSTDWNQVEFVVYCKVDHWGNSTENRENPLTLGGPTSSPRSSPPCCETASYNAFFKFTNPITTGFSKNYWKGNRWVKNEQETEDIETRRNNEWFGLAFCNYIVEENNQKFRKLELYIDVDGDGSGWRLVNQIIDRGDWGGGGTTCNGVDQQIFTWASGQMNLLFDDVEITDAKFKWISVREIDPTKTFGQDPSNPLPDPGTNPQPSPTQNILYQSNSFSNGINRSLASNGLDPFDSQILVDANTSTSSIFNPVGDGTALFSGTQSGIFILAKNYDAFIEFEFQMPTSCDNINIALRSRHEETGDCANRFGGYKVTIGRPEGSTLGTKSIVDFARENCHNTFASMANFQMSKQFFPNIWYKVRFSCRDTSDKDVQVWVDVDFADGQGLKEVARTTDQNPEPYMINRDLYTVDNSYAGIRVNGVNVQNVPIRNIVIRDITPIPPIGGGGGGGTNPNPTPNPIPEPNTNPTPTPTQAPLYRFLFWADNDTTAASTRVLTQMMTVTNVALYMFGGDGPYDTDASDWIDLMDEFFTGKFDRLILSQGNHEHPESEDQDTEDQIEAWFPGYTLNNADNNLDWLHNRVVGNVGILVMNSQDPAITTVGGDQYNYVEDVLADFKTKRAAGQIDWIFVVVHKSWYNLLSSNQAYVLAREAYDDLFFDAQVDIVVHGHNHNKHIWRPVRPDIGNNDNTAAIFTGTLLADGRWDFTRSHGPIHAVDGAGGHEHNTFGEDPSDFPNVLFADDTNFGYTQIDVRGRQLDLLSFSETGEELHKLTITRGTDSTNNPPPPQPPTGGGTTTPPPNPTPGGVIDADGIKQLVGRGQRILIERSRNESSDKRHSGNVANISQFGYELTWIASYSGANSGSHNASKMWGPNHSGDCGHTEDGECCCWYDIGIRGNGDVQLQIERPHPSNDDFTLTEDPVNGPLYKSNIGIPMEGNTIGHKLIIFPINPGGHANDGKGIRIQYYVDVDALLPDGKPRNNWEKIVDFIDTGQVLGDYIAPSEMDIETRCSDTDNLTVYPNDSTVVVKLLAGDSVNPPPIVTPPPPDLPQSTTGVNQTAALNFIKNSYRSSVQMVEEAPGFNVFWLWNDQLLAQIVLKHLDPVMATTLENRMNSFNVTMRTPWATLDPQYRSNFSIKQASEPTIQAGPPTIRYSDYGGALDLSINEFADIAFLVAIHQFYLGNISAAQTAYDAGRAFWDGQGMDDDSNITGEYATYKTALGLLAENITGFSPSIGIPDNYFGPFQHANGGIYTDKTGGVPDGSQNIETTAAVLLALNPSLLGNAAPPNPPPSGGGGNPPPPTNPPPPVTPPAPVPTQTIEIVGGFKLQRDINQIRVNACAGVGGGGGGGDPGQSGNPGIFYEITSISGDRDLSTDEEDYIRFTSKNRTSNSKMQGRICHTFKTPMNKHGSPPSSPLVTAKIWDGNWNVIYTSPTTFDPSTFTGSFVEKTFDFSTNTRVFVVGDRIGIEYLHTDDDNNIRCAYNNGGTDREHLSTMTHPNDTDEHTSKNLVCTLIE